MGVVVRTTWKCVFFFSCHQNQTTHVKEQMPSVESPTNTNSVEIIYLLGRCFNLSLNSKILEQCQYSDPTMAEKLLKDFHIMETVLNNKLNENLEDLSATMTRLDI